MLVEANQSLPQVSRLTATEVQLLDVAAALRIISESTNILHELNTILLRVNEQKLLAQIQLDAVKATMRIVKENIRALSTVARNA